MMCGFAYSAAFSRVFASYAEIVEFDAPVPADTSHPSTNLRSSENLSSRPSGSKNRQ